MEYKGKEQVSAVPCLFCFPAMNFSRQSRSNLEQVESKAITWLRFPLAAAVVFIHAYGSYPLTPATGTMEAFRLFRELGSRVLPGMAVPAFFFLSGYLFFAQVRRFTAGVYLHKLRRRATTLLVPYLLWNIVALLAYWSDKNLRPLLSGEAFVPLTDYFQRKGGWSIFWCSHDIGRDGSNWFGWPTYHLTAPIDVPLWFVRELMVLAVCSPLIYGVLKRMGWKFPAFLVLLYLLQVWPPFTGCSCTALLFFSTGACVAVSRQGLVRLCRPLRKTCCGGMVVGIALLLFMPPVHPLIRHSVSLLYIFSSTVTAINLAASLASRKRFRIPRPCTSAVFFIYAAHTILLLAATDRQLRALLPETAPWACTLRYLLCPMLTLSVCIAANALLSRLLPRLHGLLTGLRLTARKQFAG